MATKYIALKPLIVNGKKIKPGKQVVGVKKRFIDILVERGKIEVVKEDEEGE